MERAEVVIIGGGMAGIAAAIWCHRVGLSCRVLERQARLGGQLHWIHNEVPDFPGFQGKSDQLLAQLERQLEALSLRCSTGVEVSSVEPDTGRLETSAGALQADAIVLATGLRRRSLALPGLDAWRGKGVFFSASARLARFRDRDVCIVGAGDGAFENALMLAPHSPNVHILCRAKAPRARAQFVEGVEACENVHVHLEASPCAIHGSEGVEAVTFVTPAGSRQLEVQAVLLKIGFVPNSELVQASCGLEASGHVQLQARQKTSLPRVWAIGDICTPLDPSLSVAAGQACIAIRAIERHLRTR